MKILMVTFCLLPALSWSEVIKVTGHEGQDVTVQCSHSWASTNWKYFCKGQCSSGDVLIKTEEGQRNKTNGRFSMYDEATGTFWVTITGLKKTDTGTYRCAVDRFIKDTFTEVYLTVLDASQPTVPPADTSVSNQGGGQTTGVINVSDMTFSEGTTAVEEQRRSSAKTTPSTTRTAATKSNELLSLGSGLVAMVTVLALAVCIFVKVQRKPRQSLGSAPSFPRDPARPEEIRHTEYNNIEIKNLNQQPGGAPAICEDPPDTLAYSSVEFLQSQECPTYSNVTRPRKVSETPADATRNSNSVLYSSVNLPRERPDSALYSTIDLPSD